MHISTLIISTLTLLTTSVMAQASQAPCVASGLLACMEAPGLTSTCVDTVCACSQVQVQAHCYTSLCPGSTVPEVIQSVLAKDCGATAVNTGVLVTSAAAASATAAGSAAATATSKAGAETGAVAGVGGLLGAVVVAVWTFF